LVERSNHPPMNPTPSNRASSSPTSRNGPGDLDAALHDSHPYSQGAGQAGDLVRDSMLYKEFVAERDEILRHKWLESEKAGHDIGFEKALLDWVLRYRAAWRLQRSVAK
jgi:hypothetical protein